MAKISETAVSGISVGGRASEQLVNLTQTVTQAKVVREGFQVPPVALNPSKSTFFLDNLQVLNPKDEPRVVAQTIRPGTKVTPGTTVDLVLAPTSIIPFEIFENPHKDLKDKNLSVVTEGILQNPTVRQALLKYDNAGDVPAADKTALINSFKTANVNVDEGSADTSFDAAFNTMRGALAFR